MPKLPDSMEEAVILFWLVPPVSNLGMFGMTAIYPVISSIAIPR
jgi:hypothetical protein